MMAWLGHHWQSLVQTVSRMAAAPASTLANVLVVGVVLALPLGAYGLLFNIQAFSGSLPTEPQISLFLASTTPTTSTLASVEAGAAAMRLTVCTRLCQW